MSYVSYLSSQLPDNLVTLTPSKQSILSKIKTGLFINPLISESDLLLDDNYDSDPKIINNIDRYTGTDRWFCKKGPMKDDKWFMMKHPCKNNSKKIF